MFGKMNLTVKLSIPSVLLCLVAGGIGGIAYVAIENETKSFLRVSDESLPNIRMSNQMFLHFRNVRIMLRSLGLPGITAEQAAESVREALGSVAAYEKVAQQYETLTFVEGEKEIYDRVKSAFADFKAVGVRVLALQESGTEEARKQMVDIFFRDCPVAAAAYMRAIQDLVAFHQKNADGWVRDATDTARQAKAAILWALGIGLGFGALLAFLSTRSASKLVASISRVVVSLSSGADEVAGVASEVTSTSEVLSSSSVQQASAIQETTAAIEETRAMVAKNAENARHSRELAEKSQATATRGRSSVAEVIEAIGAIAASSGDIAKQIDDSNREMAEIVKVIQEIGTKTKVINDIVFQTKLLSFNASVEAARAGEQGKGFAVVAEEVGNLAQMSGNSAKEIGDLLETSTRRVSEIVAATKTKVERLVADSQTKVRSGTEIAERCAEVLTEIVGDVTRVGSLVAEISSASEEQTRGMDEVNKAVNELDDSAQRNSSASSQAAQGAETLKVQVGGLRERIRELNALVGNRDDAAAASAVEADVGEPAPVAISPTKTSSREHGREAA